MKMKQMNLVHRNMWNAEIPKRQNFIGYYLGKKSIQPVKYFTGIRKVI